MRVSLDKRFAMLWHVKKLAAFARMAPRQKTTRSSPGNSPAKHSNAASTNYPKMWKLRYKLKIYARSAPA
jgi:hypothetical protein